MRSQLCRLRAGLHPVTRCRLPQTTWADGRALRSVHGYARRLTGGEITDESFVHYEPLDFPAAVPRCGGKSAGEKAKLRLAKIQCREASNARAMRKLRKKACEAEAVELINSFELDGTLIDQTDVEELGSDEAEFWHNLSPSYSVPPKPDRFRGCQVKPSRMKPSRMQPGEAIERLMASQSNIS